jgi:hypothetical protein
MLGVEAHESAFFLLASEALAAAFFFSSLNTLKMLI